MSGGRTAPGVERGGSGDGDVGVGKVVEAYPVDHQMTARPISDQELLTSSSDVSNFRRMNSEPFNYHYY